MPHYTIGIDMDANGLKIARLTSGGVITNYHCPSRCGHCLYNSGPERSKDYLGGEMAEAIFQTILDHGCRMVHIGGGEPFVAPDKLLKVMESARESGLAIEYVETNSAWCRDEDAAVDLLKSFKRIGLEALLVSISPFHNAHIPFKRVRRLIAASRRAGIQVIPWVNAFVRDLDRLGPDRPHDMAEFEAVFGSDYLARIPDRYWIHFGGRALETFRPVYASHSIEETLANSPPNCHRALADTSHFHIDLYGNYIPGLCSGLAIAMSDLGHRLPEGRYPLIDVLSASGIRGLYELGTQTYGYIAPQNGCLSHCDLCTDIRRYLVEQHADHFPELAPVAFYGRPKSG